MDAFKPKVLITLAVFLCLLAACGPGEGPLTPEEGPGPIGEIAVDPVEEEVSAVGEIESPGGVLSMLPCTGDFQAPTPLTPNGDIFNDPAGPFTFTWEDHCQAAEYNIKVHRRPSSTGPTYMNETFTTTDSEWTIGGPLDPMTSYVWGVMAITEDGDWKTSYWHNFTTGPMCDPADLVAPIIISPADGSIDHGKGYGDITEVLLEMEYPNPPVCTPDSFMMFIADNPDFTGSNYNVFSPVGFHAGNPGSQRLVKDESNSLADCTTYFWRGWAVSGLIHGPYSETASFYTDFENSCLRSIDFEAHIDANCRSNPWINGNEVGILREGEVARMLGRDEGGFWGKFLLGNGRECWIHMSSVDPLPKGSIFNPMILEVLAHDPKPEPPPEGSDDDTHTPGQPVTACLVPNFSNPTHVSWSCVSPCPDPKYASRTCTP